MTRSSGCSLKRKCPYQAKVMKTLESERSTIGITCGRHRRRDIASGSCGSSGGVSRSGHRLSSCRNSIAEATEDRRPGGLGCRGAGHAPPSFIHQPREADDTNPHAADRTPPCRARPRGRHRRRCWCRTWATHWRRANASPRLRRPKARSTRPTGAAMSTTTSCVSSAKKRRRRARSRTSSAACSIRQAHRFPARRSRSGSAMRAASTGIRATRTGSASAMAASRAAAAPRPMRRAPTRSAPSSRSPIPGRTPHIHFAITAPGHEPLITQMYVAGEAQNERDGILNGIRDKRQRDSVIVTLQPGERLEPSALMGTFDIVVAG